MTHLEFARREKVRIWRERAEVAMGLILMGMAIGATLIVCLALDSAVRP